MSIFNPYSTIDGEQPGNPALALVDTTFKAIAELGILNKLNGLFSLEGELRKNVTMAEAFRNRKLVYTAVNSVFIQLSANPTIGDIFRDAGDKPTAIVMMPNKEIFTAHDERQEGEDADYGKTAIIGALQKAVAYQKKLAVDQPWNLRRARLVTNISDIGPAAYSGTLLCNIGETGVAQDFDSEAIELRAREMMKKSNIETFTQAITNLGTTKNMAQLVWSAIMDADEAPTPNIQGCLAAAHPAKARFGGGVGIITNQVVTSETQNPRKTLSVAEGLRS